MKSDRTAQTRARPDGMSASEINIRSEDRFRPADRPASTAHVTGPDPELDPKPQEQGNFAYFRIAAVDHPKL